MWLRGGVACGWWSLTIPVLASRQSPAAHVSHSTTALDRKQPSAPGGADASTTFRELEPSTIELLPRLLRVYEYRCLFLSCDPDTSSVKYGGYWYLSHSCITRNTCAALPRPPLRASVGFKISMMLVISIWGYWSWQGLKICIGLLTLSC